MRRFLLPLATIGMAFALAATPALADRVKDIARFEGVRTNSLIGYGLVVGLPGTGDDNLPYTLQSMRSAASALGIQIPDRTNAQLKNAAAVMITADLPPFAKPGQKIDITISALGKAKSLRGGTLLLSALKGIDGQTYALAQGNLTVAGFGAGGADGSRIVVNTPTSGRVPDGATVERAVPSPFGQSALLTLNLSTPSFANAQAVANAINRQEGPIARAIDAVSIRIDAPESAPAQVALAARIEGLSINGDSPIARVVINARTGTVVIGGNVRVLPAAVAHGNLTVAVTEDIQVSQPAPFARQGQTAVTPRSNVAAQEEKAHVNLFAPGARLSDIVDAINALGAAPGDLVAILEALKEAGALKAELVVI